MLAFVTASLLGCAGLRPFRNKLPGEPATQPAALPDDESRPTVPEAPSAFALDDDGVVRVIAGQTTCSGALIESDQVLTAHHCVAARDANGDIVNRDVPAEEVRIELGGDYLPWGEVGVRAIIAPRCGHKAGDGDIAILVLDRKLVGVLTFAPRHEFAPELGETVDPVGFGRCALSHDGIRRRHRAGSNIDKLTTGHFRLNAAICPGDSGGPALTRKGPDLPDNKSAWLIGVVSASAMDGSESTLGRTEFTRIDRWRPVFSNAKQVSSGASPAELPPIDCTR
jgi:hypothetical protein